VRVQRVVGFFVSALRGPAGGMLACVLLAAMLGGIAMANPDAIRGTQLDGAPRGGATHGGGTSTREAGGGGDGNGGGHHGGGQHGGRNGGGETTSGGSATVAGCRAIVAHLEGDVRSGDRHGVAHAVKVVRSNCRRHADAPGLARALDRLAANIARRQDRHRDGPGSKGEPPGHDGARGSDGNTPGQAGDAATGHAGANGGGSAPADPGSLGNGGSGSASSNGGGNQH
jgi:hypothetical protein